MNFTLLKTITLLYVEDEVRLQEEVYTNLSPFLEEIIVANNGLEALEIYQEKQQDIDILLTDIMMPKMNGIELVDKLRVLDSDLPVIYSTAFSDNEYLFKTIEQVISGYVLKPIDIEKLLDAISKAAVNVENKRLKESLEIEVQRKTAELQEQYKRLHEQFYKDDLTKLANRRALMNDMEKIDSPFLTLIDLDQFRSVNKIYGEHVADLVLIEIAKILQKYAQEIVCHVYRINSDEFVFLKEIAGDEKECIEKMKKIRILIQSKSIYISEYDISVNVDVTIGMAKESTNVLQYADMALKYAKKMRLPYIFYKEEYNTKREYENDIKWTKIINTALQTSQIVPFYQSIVNKDKKCVKYESLVRIVTQKELYPPFYFLSIAKKVKLYPEVEKTMIQEVLQRVKIEKINVTLNVSIEDISSEIFIDFIMKELQKDDTAKYITFELLENESIEDYDAINLFIDNVKSLGCKIAIDDFGSGYSNFSYLVKLKPDYIKIDGSLIKNIDKDKNAYIITESINDFAHKLGIKTVAEFVHSKEIFEIVKAIGVDYFQGYYFDEPSSNPRNI